MKDGELYFYIGNMDSAFEIESQIWTGNARDRNRLKEGNVFADFDTAYMAKDQLIELFKTIRNNEDR